MALTALETEMILCGGFLRREARASECALSPGDFSDAGCRALYEMCLKLEAEKQEVNLVSVCERLPALTDLAIDADLKTDSAFGRNFRQLAGTVRRGAQRRRLAEIGRKLVSGEAGGEDPEAMADWARDGIAAALAEERREETRNLSIVAGEVLSRRNRPEEKAPAVPCGLPKLDACLGGGFRPGNLVVLGARPSVGKSALLLSFVARAAAAGCRALYVSLEMTAEENAERFLALSSGYPVSWFSNDLPLSEESLNRIAEAQQDQDPALIEEYDGAACSVSDIRRLARRMQGTGGLGLIAVDYLGLITPERRGAAWSRNDEVAAISRGLKALAMEFSVPVVAAHQLNRAGAEAPRLEHLRDSGAVEQDANVVLLLHNPKDNVSDSAAGKKHLALAVAKNRQGPTGVIRLTMDAARMRFQEEGA